MKKILVDFDNINKCIKFALQKMSGNYNQVPQSLPRGPHETHIRVVLLSF